MPWFKLDDGFADHPKVRRAGNAAIGLWVRCGTYSAHYLEDGVVELDTAREYGKPREIKALLDARMWVEHDRGFLIPDYLDYNPSKEQILAERAANRERQARRRRNSHGEYS